MEMGGRIPTTASELASQLPGVGRYTACESSLHPLPSSFTYPSSFSSYSSLSLTLSLSLSPAAIASIAHGERCGVVDGNVVRVWSRLKLVGASSNSHEAIEHFWSERERESGRERQIERDKKERQRLHYKWIEPNQIQSRLI